MTTCDVLLISLLTALCGTMAATCGVLGIPVAAAAQQLPPQPPKAQLFIVHSDSCPPCRNFDDVYSRHALFRQALREAFDVRELDWDVPDQQAIARSWGVNVLPTYIVRHGHQRTRVHVGFTSSRNTEAVAQAISHLMADLGVAWPPASAPAPAPAPTPAPARVRGTETGPGDQRPAAGQSEPAADSVAREAIGRLASQSRELQRGQARTEQKVEALQADVQTIRGDITQLNSEITQSTSSVRNHVESTNRTLQESMELQMRSIFGELNSRPADPKPTPTTPEPPSGVSPKPDLPRSVSQNATSHQTASKWLQVATWLGRTGLTLAAPEIAIPGSLALTAAGFGLSWLRRRRQPKPLGSVDNPIRVTDPAGVRTETKFVLHESDVLGESFKEAIRRVGNAHRENSPEVIEVLQQVDAAATQLAHGRRLQRRPSVSPVSENAP